MTATVVEDGSRTARRARGRWSDRLLYAYTWLIIIWLCLPIAVMIAFGFNDAKYGSTSPGRASRSSGTASCSRCRT